MTRPAARPATWWWSSDAGPCARRLVWQPNPAGLAATSRARQAEMEIGAGPGAAAGKAPWPKALPEQIAAVRTALSELVARRFSRARAASVRPLLESLGALGQARLVEGGRFAA